VKDTVKEYLNGIAPQVVGGILNKWAFNLLQGLLQVEEQDQIDLFKKKILECFAEWLKVPLQTQLIVQLPEKADSLLKLMFDSVEATATFEPAA